MPSSHFSRRSFLKSTLAAGVAPLILPSRIWSAETKPNDRLTIGFIGIGKQARGLMSGFLSKAETQTVAVCDVDRTRREDGKKQVETFYAKQTGSDFKGCDAQNDFRELLGRKDIDAVVIATPDHWHALIAIAAAKAGKDIYCEKPLTHTIHEAWTLVGAVRKNQRVFQTGSMQRSSREFRVACELARNGVIGKIMRVTAGFGGPAKPCDLPAQELEDGLDWDFWLGPAPSRPYNEVLSPRGVHNHFPAWRAYREYGGGGVTDWGAHHLDIAHWGLGADSSGPLEITPPADSEHAEAGVKLRYADDVEVEHVKENGVTFFGPDGEIYVNRGKIKVTVKGAEKAKFLAKEDKPSLNEQLDALEKEFLANAKVKLYASTDHKADFLAAIKSRKPPIADVEIGARSVTGCHLINLAYYHGKPMKWDPAKNNFAKGSGDAKWLTRDY
ncbi:MAG TPA: Gfo/Idh/MocA family oxidoreductase, partial [Chthoniobacteraceae bacterium]|nr:Gfo/Idh/MocA family oxidoreductase [Chthoniobacteraceae bacterium]